MTIQRDKTLQGRLTGMLDEAMDYFGVIAYAEKDFRLHFISEEFAAGLKVLPSFFGEEGQFTSVQGLLAVRRALERYRGALGDEFPFKRHRVEALLKEVESQERQLRAPAEGREVVRREGQIADVVPSRKPMSRAGGSQNAVDFSHLIPDRDNKPLVDKT